MHTYDVGVQRLFWDLPILQSTRSTPRQLYLRPMVVPNHTDYPPHSGDFLPEDQQLQNWLAIKVLSCTVHLRTEAFVPAQTVTAVRDPRFYNATVIGACFILTPRADNLFQLQRT